jgi:hypothetical protein
VYELDEATLASAAYDSHARDRLDELREQSDDTDLIHAASPKIFVPTRL